MATHATTFICGCGQRFATEKAYQDHDDQKHGGMRASLNVYEGAETKIPTQQREGNTGNRFQPEKPTDQKGNLTKGGNRDLADELQVFPAGSTSSTLIGSGSWRALDTGGTGTSDNTRSQYVQQLDNTRSEYVQRALGTGGPGTSDNTRSQYVQQSDNTRSQYIQQFSNTNQRRVQPDPNVQSTYADGKNAMELMKH